MTRGRSVSVGRSALGVGVLVLLLGPGCGKTTKTAAPTAKRSQLTIEAGEYHFSGPETVAGGSVDLLFRNTGKLAHEAALLRIGDTPPEKVIQDFGSVVEGGAIPDYLGASGGVAKVKGGATGSASFQLKPGKYLFVCSLTDDDSKEGDDHDESKLPKHFTLGMAKPLTVEGAGEAALPTTQASISAHDYNFDLDGLKAGDNSLTFRNSGPGQIHHVVVEEFPEGADEAAATSTFEAFAQSAQSGGPPGAGGPPAEGGPPATDGPPGDPGGGPGDAVPGEAQAPPGAPRPKQVLELQPLDPGLSETSRVTLQSGRTYLFACFIQDRTGGPPHAFGHQMYKVMKIA